MNERYCLKAGLTSSYCVKAMESFISNVHTLYLFSHPKHYELCSPFD